MSGCGQGHEPQENWWKKPWLKKTSRKLNVVYLVINDVVPYLCAGFHGGTHPPLQAVHRGFPGSSRGHIHCGGGTQGGKQGREDRFVDRPYFLPFWENTAVPCILIPRPYGGKAWEWASCPMYSHSQAVWWEGLGMRLAAPCSLIPRPYGGKAWE